MANPIVFGAQQFHCLYNKCFVELNEFDRAAVRSPEEVQRELPLLVLADSEEKIIENIKRIKNLFSNFLGSILFDQLKSFSKEVENGAKFWTLFDSKIQCIQLDQTGPVRQLVIKRIKALQEDFQLEFNKKQQHLNEHSLKECLNDPHFFNPPKESPGILYTNVEYLPGSKIDRKSYSLYSDKYMNTRKPEMIEAIKTIREECVALAKTGQLIQVCFLISESNPTEIQRHPLENTPESIIRKCCETMTALVYNEKREGRISSMEDAFDFIETQIKENTLFSDADQLIKMDTRDFLEECKTMVQKKLRDIFESN